MKKIVSKSEKETFDIGFKIGEKLYPGSVVALFGDLGCGKTALTQGIGACFNVQNVVSPTFTLVNEYNSKVPIYHFDAYRIDADGWIDAGFDEYLFADGICIIEWADNLNGILPENTIKITISKNLDKGENYREITIEGVDF